jgi:GNAT superfamily N-acetyltransferase
MTMVTIRPLQASDRSGWDSLWAGYLCFYEAELTPNITDVTWQRLIDVDGPIHCFVAERDGQLIGFVHYLFHPATWSIGPYCYLEDLFTATEARGFGTGRALIEAVASAAYSAGASKLYWLTQESNQTARTLYDKLARNAGFIQYSRTL